ncbi:MULTISPECIES: hypothetical protein [unclassified Pseudomonas]|uniref:hypothetical protein n=1 Tax=unclassified Pseudomonas TaxID=196821 RepID=UPI000839A986|nr:MULTISPECIES: hypothetical protein [unclassified Pseudomonas]QIH09760.1 hypothetical protein ATY02_25125 [Pseudomonas sp. BIOMIG1BAC]
MTPERFAQLADAYGSDLRRWPEAERSAARRLLDTGHPDALQALQQANWLDGRLDSYQVPEPSHALIRHIVASASAQQRAVSRWPRHSGWLASLGWLGVGLSGVAAGMLAVALSLPLPHSTEALPSVFDQSDAEFVLSINTEEAEQ